MSQTRDIRGQVLVGVIMLLLVLLIIVPALVQWVQLETKQSVQNQKTEVAFNLAQAAVERGMWKAKSSVAIWQQLVLSGTPVAGYNFDATYTDVPGGSYRIKISRVVGVGVSSSVVIVGEGRDNQTQQTQAISTVFQNQAVYGPLMASQGAVMNMGMCPLWGPIMSQGNIYLADDVTAFRYFPRKYAKGDVSSNDSVNYPRDVTWPNPPNTDGIEWWSNYQYVPEVPILDFATLRAQANATHTLNVYGCATSTSYSVPGTTYTAVGPAPWDTRRQFATNSPGSAPVYTGAPHCGNIGANDSLHFSASCNHPQGACKDPNNSYTWYYDGDLTLGGDQYYAMTYTGATTAIGLRGTLIVRGNLTLDATGDYDYTNNVPVNAAAEMNRLTYGTYDTSAIGEYPADYGMNQTTALWHFGTDSSNFPGSAIHGWKNTVGVRGFTYVGKNLSITTNGFMDFNGAVWVNGSVTSNGASLDSFCGIYYDDTIQLPTLNVVLVRKSWQKVPASSVAWP